MTFPLADLPEGIRDAEVLVPVLDERGELAGLYTPYSFRRSPYTREEIERIRQHCRETGGKPLAEVLASFREPNP